MTNLLLDTHTLLWYATDDRRLSRTARRHLSVPHVRLFISVVTVWEIAIKCTLKQLILPTTVEQYIEERLHAGLTLLPIHWKHAAAVSLLPLHHRDPFDRLLIAQSIHEEIPLVSGDKLFKKYGATIIW